MLAIVRPGLHRILPLFSVFLVLPQTATAQKAERYTLLGNEVSIYNLAGEVRVESGGGPGVSVEVTRGGSDGAKIKVAQSGDEGDRSFRLIYPADRIVYGRLSGGSSTQLRVREDGTFGNNHGHGHDHDEKRRQEGRQVTIAGSGGGLQAYADLRVIVPRGKNVELHLAAGKVAVNNVEGDLDINAASAGVTSTNTRGELSIGVGSGPVQVTQSRGELSVSTGSGAVALGDVRGEQVSVATGSGEVTATDIRSAELSVETGSGDIRVSNLMAPQIKLETGSGAVTADVSGELWSVNVETGSGDITLRVPPTLGAEVDIETSSGDIETDFEVAVTRHARDHMTGRIGDGRGKIDIETGSGTIRLVKNTGA